MANEYVNQVGLADGTILLDVSTDTAAQEDVASGKYFHLKTGQRVQGTNTYDSDTTDADATAADIAYGKTAYVNKNKITGELPIIGSTSGTIDTVAGTYTIPAGIHSGLGSVAIDNTEQSKIIPGNIKSGIQILGVTGSYSGESVTAGSLSATPYLTGKTYQPSDISKDYFSEVTVAAITITRTDNAAGGVTVTIGAEDPDAD